MSAAIAFTPDVEAELLEVEAMQVDLIEVDSSLGSSELQAMRDFLTLDAGRPMDDFTYLTPLDGGRA